MNAPDPVPPRGQPGAPADPKAPAAPAPERGPAAVAGAALPHESAHLHVAGAAPYTDDLPELQGTLHAALGLSPVAHGRITALDLARLRAQPGVVAVYTAADIPGPNDCGPIVHDDPILADLRWAPGVDATTGGACEGLLRHVGQPVLAVIARSREQARRAAALTAQCLQTTPLPAVLTAREAHAQQQYVVPPMHLARGDAAAAIAAAPHRLQGHFVLGGQEQFYLEGQISLAQPQEDGAMLVHCSTQHPTEMQHAVAHALGLAAHRVQVRCRRMGGGFGGKESQSALFACVAALAAAKLGVPVKLRPDRDDDFEITGRRHPFDFDWSVGFDDEGRLLGAEFTLLTNAGHSADLSPPVMTRAICHIDNAYWLPNVALHGYCCRTNTQSNTAFRGFGGPQGALVTEMVLDSVARHLGRDALAVRQANFYGVGERDVTPYGQRVEDNIITPLVAQLASDAAYAQRRTEVQAFNASSPVLKKGLALTPVKFGISFNVAHFNQAGALVHVYADGSVLVNHGGTEMGQGLNTKVAQVVAHELGLPLARVRVTATDTDKVANTSATAASTGADLNGKAAQDAARQIRRRLARLLLAQHGQASGAADAAVASPVPHAPHAPNAPETDAAADAVQFVAGQARLGPHAVPFDTLVQQAYAARVQLWSDGFYATPGLHWDRERLQGKPFYYFAYGAACAEVVVDTLTGEHRVLRVDALHDVGQSLNPAIDIGQVEGAFVQGQGWLTMEELWWQPLHDAQGQPARHAGRLMTHAPSTYKIPTANDMPRQFNVRLYGQANPADTIHRSKAVGEPPLLLPFAVLLAIRDAVSAVGDHRSDPPLRAPATPEAVLDALDAVRAPAAAAPPGSGSGSGSGSGPTPRPSASP